MQSLNLCQFIGNVGRDPETRYGADGGAITSLSIGCNWKTKDKEGTEWVRVVFFGKLAEIAGEYLKKGAKVYVQGRMTTRKWTDKDGVERYTTEIVGDQMLMVGSKGEGKAVHATEDETPRTAKRGESKTIADMDDDVPF